ncbi:MAG: alpha amylase C-terminal domain-containing protein, partial [Anaerolineaceae bacterium]|nr:alpha amylase C-terminal domain-containing protein [Anaerolineaceae bacterium]
VMDRFGGLKVLYVYQFTHPGKKLLFMGQDFAQERDWNVNESIDWHLADDFGHRDIMQCMRNLLDIYKKYPALYNDSRDTRTFEWVNRNDADRDILCYIRRNPWTYDGAVLVVLNFSPNRYDGYTCGIPFGGRYRRVFDSYDSLPGGGSPGELGGIPELPVYEGECDGYRWHLCYDLRPFEAMIVELPREQKK